MSSNKELSYEIPHLIRVYKDETIERLMVSPYAPPSLDDPITGISSKDVVISPDFSARVYLPKLTSTSFKKLPLLVYMHGGGFVLGSAFTLLEHNYLTTMVSHINALVISVEYRLAPENLLPTAYEDCWTALQWVASHSTSDGRHQEPCLVDYGDFDRLYIGGDGSGANIVHNLSLKAGKERLNNDVQILGGFLGCPFFLDFKTCDESLAYKFWMLSHPHAHGGIDNALINPFVDRRFEADFGCKRLLVVVAEKDSTREIGIKYFETVKESEWDGEVEILDIEGEGHCFYVLDSTSEKAKILMNHLACFIV
ncbi:putative 2-hydroxyisoflavanone dehydratase, Carboxylesterase [Helianthus annuus]|nr:putative 2-hydroxyisoflavanone dehydratase, Carboxylesterase [Helianthus annuus]KAJ0883701.1 putative 2-hydroxyisoflavanone dehydratase, Carboxylesterase [Helianthus annuus]